MTPLFKTHYSLGKSILTLASPDSVTEGGPSSVLEIVQRHAWKRLVLVEDSLIGFLEAKKGCDELGVQLVFGLRLSMATSSPSPTSTLPALTHKIIVFAKNTEGCHLLNKIYTAVFSRNNGTLSLALLKDFYDSTSIEVAIPFYDSFLFHNLFSYNEPLLLDHSFFNPTFFIEDNLLPFDGLLTSAIESYASKNNLPTEKVKSIYYASRDDFESYQTYKCICGRNYSSRIATLDKPNLEHCASPEFCVESYLDYEGS